MIPARRWLPLALLALLVGGTGLVALQKSLDGTLAEYRLEEELLYLSSPRWVKRLSFGYDGLLASIYWTRAVQHYGRERLGKQEYRLLYSLLDISTTLDPQLIIAYRFGAIFLTEKPPKGPGQYEKAVELLQKGIRNNPDYWRFWYDLGFLHYRAGHYQRAAEAFHQGAKNPEAPAWMNAVAARVATEGGQRSFAGYLWSQLYYSTDSPQIQKNAEEHLEGLKADDDIEALQTLVDRYQQQTGQWPESFQELVREGMLPGIPLDPREKYPYVIDPQGKVRLRPESPIDHSQLGRPE